MSGVTAAPAPTRLPGPAFALLGAGFLAAAVVAAVVRVAAPFDKGWWLVAYLALVGGVAQPLLGSGLAALAERAEAGGPGRRETLAQLVLWNAGTVVVAVADLAESGPGVLAGSALLLVALGLFTVALRRVSATARSALGRWPVLYVLLVVFLAGSTAVGAVLAEALPGQ
jgi:hypothetical protein